jgi:hypothetical protein
LIPKKLVKNLDERCGEKVTITVKAVTEAKRCERFNNRIRCIVQRLKQTSCKHSLFTKIPTSGHGQDQDILTNGFAQLLERTKDDFLVESILHGVPTSTKLILGKPQFTLQDLKTLPCLSNSELTEQGIYIDVVEIGNNDNVNDWRLYVGSASGQFGVAQRWHTYLEARPEKTRHAREIKKPGRTINLRCIAHFGFSPEFWLTAFAESVFMLYLDTIHDPRISWNSPDYSNKFINDALYREVSAIRSDCALPIVEGRGLNQTWSLAQGWKGVGIKPGAKCVNCPRVVLEPNDPKFKRDDWRYADPIRPSASNVICYLCRRYQKRHGKARPSQLEERRDRESTDREKADREKTDRCEYDNCPRTEDIHWFSEHKKFYCKLHSQRVLKNTNMNLPVGEKTTLVKAIGTNPGKCEHGDCNSTHKVEWYGQKGHKKYYCSTHYSRARNGRTMTPVGEPSTKVMSTRKNPGKCEQVNCNSTQNVGWYGKGHEKYYCGQHHQRASKGRKMDAPFRN